MHTIQPDRIGLPSRNDECGDARLRTQRTHIVIYFPGGRWRQCAVEKRGRSLLKTATYTMYTYITLIITLWGRRRCWDRQGSFEPNPCRRGHATRRTVTTAHCTIVDGGVHSVFTGSVTREPWQSAHVFGSIVK